MIFNGARSSFSRADSDLFNLAEAWTEKYEDGLSEYFVKYPLFRIEAGAVYSQGMLVSQRAGVVLLSHSDANKYTRDSLGTSFRELDEVYGYLTAKLVKNVALRKKGILKFSVSMIVYAPNLEGEDIREFEEADAVVVRSMAELENAINDYCGDAIEESLYRELVGTIDGAKSLVPISATKLSEGDEVKRIGVVAEIESSIRDFDNDQKQGFMREVVGPQRIRGLAGSGKTVILALKVALIHAKYPSANIVYTYYTKHLRQIVKRLISRFYAEYSDAPPDWSKIKVMHAWGGQSLPGFYSEYCGALGIQYLRYSQAQARSPRGVEPFEYACGEALSAGPKPVYDYVFVDEAQDFGPNFLRLALASAVERKVVIGLDVFQTIFQVTAPAIRDVIGDSGDLTEDIVLKACYRTPRSILVCAHAMGLGIYKRTVQMLESLDHWRDIGYEHVSGDLRAGERVCFERPKECAPLLTDVPAKNLMKSMHYSDFSEEVNAVVVSVVADIKQQGLRPEDVMIICADDYNCKTYFSALTKMLADEGVFVNNTQNDSNGIVGFSIKDRVTLTTLHKAKGNEAYSVHVVGIDAIYSGAATTVTDRNRIFTVMTRTKGWLSITGVGADAEDFSSELEVAMNLSPRLDFEYPSDEEARRHKRDILLVPQAEKDDALRALISKYGVDFVKEYLSSVKPLKEKK